MIVLIAGFIWMYISPPDLIRVGANYSAKTVCSNVFIAGRDPETVLKVDVQAPGHPMLRYMNIDVDVSTGVVTAGLFGLFGRGRAQHVGNVGCYNTPNGAPAPLPMPLKPESDETGIDLPENLQPKVQAIIADPRLQGPSARAIVVLHRGRLVAETYPEDGFSASTPLLGWSMTKSVTAAILGRMIEQGRLSLEDKNLFAEWSGDGRKDISIADMLAMASGLQWNEGYGSVSDVTQMLYLTSDMPAFVRDHPLEEEPGGKFLYSSGTTVLLSHIWQSRFDDRTAAMRYPYEELFNRLDMSSAVLETDATGTYAGSSYLYATARDWARFGQFLLNDGRAGDRRLLPEGFVEWMREPHPASNGRYGRGHVWIEPPNFKLAGENPEIPADTFWFAGHDGQSVAIIPSHQLVIVRMGLTPSETGYKPAHLAKAVADWAVTQ